MNTLADRTTAELRAAPDAMQARTLASIERDRHPRSVDTSSRDVGAERMTFARDRLAELGPLPDALGLAGPIISTLRAVVDAFSDRGEFLAWPPANGAMVVEMTATLRTADTRAAVLRTWVESAAIPDDDAAAQAVDVLTPMRCSVQPVEHALDAEHHGFGTIGGRQVRS